MSGAATDGRRRVTTAAACASAAAGGAWRRALTKLAGTPTRPYHAYIPSFGEWGFVLATRQPSLHFGALPDGLSFLDRPTLETLFLFPPDMQVDEGPINRLDNQALVRLYEEDWRDMLKR